MNSGLPILEFDPTPEAIIEPNQLIEKQQVPKHAVICFFKEVIKKIAEEHNAKVIYTSHSEMGEHPVYELEYKGKRIVFYHPGVGAPLAVGLTEEVIALGVKNFIAVGGCGVLDKDITVGHVLLPVTALRGEGTSYHYAAPSRQIDADPDVIMIMESVLAHHRIAYKKTKTWTTDAFYRETKEKVCRYLAEGCLAVEMENASLIALSKFRGVRFGQYLYGGDLVLAEGWDAREWNSRQHVREQLFWLAVETCFKLDTID